ncbi:glycosyltransferase family 4 protein [Ekhidna sp.]|uniref:glycosyltransferase family 4 protein n=1 Tax=Ekhidna sp. TaxID=2608089 RepID=UPI003C798086
MKVAFVANTCWNIYNFRKGLVHHFLLRGDEVIVLAPEDEYTECIQHWGVKWIDTPLQGTGANPVKDLGYLMKLHSIFKKERPDVALSFTIKANIYASLVGKFSSVPVICNVSGLGTVFLVQGLIGTIALRLYKIAFKSANYIFFQNEDDKKLFETHVKLRKERTGVLPGSGIDLTHFKPTTIPKNETIHFLMISRVIVEKGVREYAEAAAFFKDEDHVRFTLVGKFDENHSRSVSKEELDQWVSKGIIDYIPHSDEIEKLITESHAIVLPSYREGTPRTLLEGAAMGRPLLASNVPGCREVVKDGFNGFLFEVKNAKSIVDKVKLFLALDLEERTQLATNSRKLVEEAFDENIVIDMYDRTIRRIIKPS